MAAPVRHEEIDHAELLQVLSAVKQGDFGSRMRVKGSKANRQVAAALNEIIQLNNQTANEFARVANAVAKEGRVETRARQNRVAGQWAAKINSVNTLVGVIAQQSDEMGRVIGA